MEYGFIRGGGKIIFLPPHPHVHQFLNSWILSEEVGSLSAFGSSLTELVCLGFVWEILGGGKIVKL